MSASSDSKKTWILQADCLSSVDRLWKRYHFLSINQENNKQLSFSKFRLISLGVPEQIATNVPEFTRPTLVTDSNLLTWIENYLMDENGKSLQKFVVDDLNSRVLIDIEKRFSDAQELTQEAIALLEDLLPWNAILLKKMIPWVIPIYHENYGRPFRRGFSHIKLLGAIFTTYIERLAQDADLRRAILAIDLAHELGHQVLMVYQLADKLIETPLTDPVFSTVRKVNRPAIMALHACSAAAYMIEVCAAIAHDTSVTTIENSFAKNSLIELTQNQRLGLQSLRRVSRFTPIGERIMCEFEEQLQHISQHQITYVKEPLQRMSYFELLAP